ncbi:MAG TPA: 1-(5-phosphoribosyl)-5-[(5-phosphoribosylamino)methylideneamino]imidazole-4-carboxamide isomerase [Pyrinomonadaceae bacterium]|nr:1-(5-phosphoribosyl)-5-[(5-phosphoribosylamino)methylideneamino]imidazole-4-carboxamide isomerase [Pyrinomonadaceae bacterium]
MLVVPAIDLRNGHCVRLLQGRSSEMRVYDTDPLDVAQQFAAAGAELIHVVDLDGAFGQKSANRRIVAELVEHVGVPIQFGGGVRSAEDIQELLKLGVFRVILGTLATESSDKLAYLVEQFGDAVAVAIDARKESVMVRGWESRTEITATKLASLVGAAGVQRIIYTDISRDGMLGGVNVEQTISVARSAAIAVTASGGIGSLNDIRDLRESGEPLIDSVIVGRALYEGRFTLAEAIQAAQ